MCHWASQFYVAHALTTHLSQGHFYATLFTDHTAMLQTLVLTAQTFVVFYWAENLGTEQAFALWLEGTVVNGFWLFYFAKRP